MADFLGKEYQPDIIPNQDTTRQTNISESSIAQRGVRNAIMVNPYMDPADLVIML